ncbi:SAM-dependent methyltransferase, partial [Saccharopolyspora sp. HNM0983]
MVRDDGPDVPDELDLDSPNAARMYDYYLGGSQNFAVDRAAAEQQLAVLPDVAATARANRA